MVNGLRDRVEMLEKALEEAEVRHTEEIARVNDVHEKKAVALLVGPSISGRPRSTICVWLHESHRRRTRLVWSRKL